MNDIIKEKWRESEVEPNCDDGNEERIFEDDGTSPPNENICRTFAFFVEKKDQ